MKGSGWLGTKARLHGRRVFVRVFELDRRQRPFGASRPRRGVRRVSQPVAPVPVPGSPELGLIIGFSDGGGSRPEDMETEPLEIVQGP